MPVQYNSKKIIPAPLVSVEKNYTRTGDTNKVGSTFTFNLSGTITACGGSPNSAGEFWSLSGYPDAAFQDDYEQLTDVTKRQKFLQAKMQAIRRLFADDGYSFEVQPYDGSAPMKCYPRVINMTFNEGVWVDRIDYTITLEADEVFGLNTAFMSEAEDFSSDEDFFKDADGNKLYLSEVTENWQLELVDGEPEDVNNPATFRLTHNVSAVGKKVYDDGGLVSAGWEQAKRWVTPRLGADGTFINNTAGLGLTGMLNFNHIRQESTDELAGSYAVTETWLLAKGNSREDFTVSTQTSVENGITTVNVEGEVIGLESRDSNYAVTESKWTAALAKFNSISTGVTPTIFTRAQTYSGVVLNSTALSSNIGRNPITGRITYNYQYDTRPTNCIDGALTENITITDKNPTDIFAIIPVIGRTAGPILQDMNTTTERERTVAVNVNVTPVANCPLTPSGVALVMASSPASQVNLIFEAFEDDLELNYSQVFKREDTPSWDYKNGRYSRTVTWTFSNCG